MMDHLQRTIKAIQPVDEQAASAARKHWDSLVKPIGSLGRLEELVVQLAAIQRRQPASLVKRAVVVFAADNGVVEEGVASAPQEVTAIQAVNFVKGIAGISVFSRMANADLTVIDIGVASDQPLPGVLSRRVAAGTKNIADGPAMSGEECLQALRVGIEIAESLAGQGYQVLIGGEMGIGNTTTSSCLTARLLSCPPAEVVGKGAGLTEDGLRHKLQVVERALRANPVQADDPLALLSALGGFDIAGLTGFYLGGAAAGLPLIIDGFISAVAALLALRLAPAIKPYLIASHISAEPGYNAVIEAMGLHPVLDLKMRLGEGTGAVLLLPLLDAALAAFTQMGALRENHIDPDDLVDIRKGGA